jgi:hypothetical protein
MNRKGQHSSTERSRSAITFRDHTQASTPLSLRDFVFFKPKIFVQEVYFFAIVLE